MSLDIASPVSRTLLFVLLVSNSISAAPPPANEPLPALPLPTYLSKTRTLFALDDPSVPSALVSQAFSAIPVVSDSRGAVWMATSGGLKRYDPASRTRDRWQFFAGRRWLADNSVQAILPDATGGVWVRTATGVSHIEFRPFTLEQKTISFEERIRLRHNRHGLVADSRLERPGDLSSSRPEPSDNDGLWTAIYGAAECFRYAVTESSDALALARQSLDAVLFLEQVTGRPGYPARSYVVKGEDHPSDGVWSDTPDGRFTWKGDTSSDEIAGHFFLYSVAFDRLPGAAEKQKISAAAARIADHILEHGYNLTGPDGKPTTWGRWSLDYFATPAGRPDSPLNAVELLSFLKTAAHITGDSRYETEYRKAALDLGYAKIATRYLELRQEINYSDEELAMLSFYPLFRYETDPQLLALYRNALAQWWRNMRREQNPLWTFIYLTAIPAARADLNGPVWVLQRIPMDLIDWTVLNSTRSDVTLDAGPDRFEHPQSSVLLPPDERPVMKWNGNPFIVDGGDGALSEDDGAFFLLPYWMGRYHRIIEEAAAR